MVAGLASSSVSHWQISFAAAEGVICCTLAGRRGQSERFLRPSASLRGPYLFICLGCLHLCLAMIDFRRLPSPTAVKSHHVLKYPWDLWHFQHLMVKETQETQLPSMGLLPPFSAPIETRLHLFLQDAEGGRGGERFCNLSGD